MGKKKEKHLLGLYTYFYYWQKKILLSRNTDQKKLELFLEKIFLICDNMWVPGRVFGKVKPLIKKNW